MIGDVMFNSNFSDVTEGELQGWHTEIPRPFRAPSFAMVDYQGVRALQVAGAGEPDCVGAIRRSVKITLGRSYAFSVRFGFDDNIDPHQNLLFQCFHKNTKAGIFTFRRENDSWATGHAEIFFPGVGEDEVELRIVFRFSAQGRAWISNLDLVESAPIEPKWVKVACTAGKPSIDSCRAALDFAGSHSVDVMLLPEYMQGEANHESFDGISGSLMADASRRHQMYVAGGIVRENVATNNLYNTALLYDRQGMLMGYYMTFG